MLSYNQDDGINTLGAVASGSQSTQTFTGLLDNSNVNFTGSSRNGNDKLGDLNDEEKKQKMWLVQSGKHVSLVPNHDPWFLNVNYTDGPIESVSNYESNDNKNDQKYYTEQNYKNESNEKSVEKDNAKTITPNKMINNYIPYTLIYLLVFFAILVVIYKLGTRQLSQI